MDLYFGDGWIYEAHAASSLVGDFDVGVGLAEEAAISPSGAWLAPADVHHEDGELLGGANSDVLVVLRRHVDAESSGGT